MTYAAFNWAPFNCCSVIQSYLNICDPMNYHTPGFPVLHYLPESAQTHVHWDSDAFQPSHPLSSPSPPAFNLSQHQGLFQWALRIGWPKDWSFSFSISPSKEYSGLISFRIDCCDLFAVQGTCKRLIQHHSLKAINFLALSLLYGPILTSIHDYWKTHDFGYTDFVSKVISAY